MDTVYLVKAQSSGPNFIYVGGKQTRLLCEAVVWEDKEIAEEVADTTQREFDDDPAFRKIGKRNRITFAVVEMDAKEYMLESLKGN